MGRPIKDRSGERYGRLVAEKVVAQTLRKEAVWRCRCDCGGTTLVAGSKLTSGTTESCGCLKEEYYNRGPDMVELVCRECGDGFERHASEERIRKRRGRAGPYCTPDCMYVAQSVNPVDSFMEKWEYDEGCWRWTAATGNQGHGRFWDSGELVQAHRFAFEKFYSREILEGLEVHHTCQNPSCVYPLHLMEVTHKQHANLHT